MFYLNRNVLFFEIEDGKNAIYNNLNKKLYKVNNSVIDILKMCNGKFNEDYMINCFGNELKNNVKMTIDYLVNEKIINTGDEHRNRALQYDEISTFYLSLTNNCNLRCHFCLNEVVSSKYEMPLEQWKNIIDIIERFNNEAKTIYLTGGEPIIYHDFEALYTYIYKKNFKINIFTNGTLLNDQIIKLFCKLPPNAMLLSIDGSTSKLHDQQRGISGTYEKIINNTRSVIKKRISSILLWQSVICKNNLYDMENIVKLAIETGIKHVRFSLISSIGKGFENENSLSEDMMVEFYENLIVLVKKYNENITINQPLFKIQSNKIGENFSSCGIGNMIHIDACGYVSPCYGMHYPNYKRGPINSLNDLKTINFSEFYGYCVEDYEECSRCGVRNICNGGCKSEIYEVSGSIHKCILKKKWALEKYLRKVLIRFT